MKIAALLEKIAPRRPPDRLDGPAHSAAAGKPDGAPAHPPQPAQPARAAGGRRELEVTLARKILESHLEARHSQMRSDPTDLRGVEREDAKLLIRAMAAAAHADGQLDERERAHIVRALTSTRLNEAERTELETALPDPPCLETLLRAIAGEDMARRFYAVSLAATAQGRGSNRPYFAYLAHRLQLPRDVILRLNRAFDVPV